MASQRPAWFRLSSMRPAAPTPTPAPAPAPAPAPTPAVVRPALPVRPPSQPAQAQEPAPPPAAASAPPTAPSSPPKPAAAPPRSPVAAPPVAAPAPPPAPRSPPVAAPAPPPRSPVAPPVPAAAPRPPPSSPVVPPPPQPSPPKAPAAAPAPKSPTPAPRTPPPTSPVTKAAVTTSTNFQQPSSSSAPPPAQAPSSTKPTSPVPKPVATAAPSGAVNGKAAAATPVSSPKIVKPSETAAAQSPKSKPLSRPPSPLTLPPPQIRSAEGEREPKIEQKNVLVQERIEKPVKEHNAHNHGIASKGNREVPAMKDKGTGKKLSDSEEMGMRIITISGDNKGALMEISSSHKKIYPVGKAHTLQKQDGEEGKSDDKEKSDKSTTMQSQPMTTFLNSNVQGVNNSIVLNSNCHLNDPGVHLSLVRKANGGRTKD